MTDSATRPSGDPNRPGGRSPAGTGRVEEGRAERGRPEHKGPATQVAEFKDLVVAYAKQETIDPLKALGRHMGFGIGGALLIGLGWGFALLAILRGLQRIEFFNDPSQADGGTWSWLPYLIVALIGTVVTGLYARILMKRINDDGRS